MQIVSFGAEQKVNPWEWECGVKEMGNNSENSKSHEEYSAP